MNSVQVQCSAVQCSAVQCSATRKKINCYSQVDDLLATKTAVGSPTKSHIVSYTEPLKSGVARNIIMDTVAASDPLCRAHCLDCVVHVGPPKIFKRQLHQLAYAVYPIVFTGLKNCDYPRLPPQSCHTVTI